MRTRNPSVMIASLLLAIFGIIGSTVAQSRDTCGPCDPPGYTSTNAPLIGNGDMGKFYDSLVGSVQGIQFSRRHWTNTDRKAERQAKPAPICCAPGTQCLLLASYGLPLCYDKFTTNFFLPDGSYGTIHTGNYTTASGDKVNLITGDFAAAGGANSNLYSGSKSREKPNTANLAIPSQWTSNGVGSAIPASALGVILTTIYGPTTIPASTIIATTVPAQVVSGTTTPATTISATTVPAETFTAATTITIQSGTFMTGSAAVSTSASFSTKRRNEAPGHENSLGTLFAFLALGVFFH